MPFVESYEIPGKPWGEELVLVHTDLYTLKRLTYEPGHQGALQYHERKDEAFYLHSGTALVSWDEGSGLQTRVMQAGEAFHVRPGTPHKVRAMTRCVMYEVSNPVFDDRVNAADSYGDSDGLAR